jgi:hypothetical protein
MTPDTDARAVAQAPATRNYVFLSLAGLGVLLLVLVQAGFGLWALLLVLAGGLGVAVRLRFMPLFVLVALAGMYLVGRYLDDALRLGAQLSSPLADGLLTGSYLVYALAHYRLLGLTAHIFPPDPRRREGRRRWHFSYLRWLPEVVRQRRSPNSVFPGEVALAVTSVVISGAVAFLILALLPRNWYALNIPPWAWRALLLAWFLGLALLIVSTAVGHWGGRRMSSAEAALLLQETFWRELRGEQRTLNRWLAWARLRHLRRKEQ